MALFSRRGRRQRLVVPHRPVRGFVCLPRDWFVVGCVRGKTQSPKSFEIGLEEVRFGLILTRESSLFTVSSVDSLLASKQ